MITEVILPRQGNTVESCIIVAWRKKCGDPIMKGDLLCEVETDKATFEIEAEVEGTLLDIFYADGAEVPVLKVIALIGDETDDRSQYQSSNNQPELQNEEQNKHLHAQTRDNECKIEPVGAGMAVDQEISNRSFPGAVSPRAKNLARDKQINLTNLAGTGPGGRIIERDVQNLIEKRGPISPAAASLHQNSKVIGSGIGGRIIVKDLEENKNSSHESKGSDLSRQPEMTVDIPVKGIRKLIAQRMQESLSTTAQLTLSASAPAESLLSYRKKLKNSALETGLQAISMNDLILFSVSRVLKGYLNLNAYFLGDKIRQFDRIHLGFAVDTAKGLMVPVIKNADSLSLKEISFEAKRLIKACQSGNIKPDDLAGGTFTVTNLGALGIEEFTPVLNLPQVAILGICNIQLKPVYVDDTLQFLSYLGLSLTINHQAVDGAPGARFLQELCHSLNQIELLLAG